MVRQNVDLAVGNRLREVMAAPQEVIENIRRKEFLIGVKLSPEVEEGAHNMRLNLNNALKGKVDH